MNEVDVKKITSSLTKSNFSLEENVGIAGEVQVLTYYYVNT